MNRELYHAGIKGMKWGVRNDSAKSSGSRKSKATNTGPVTKTKIKGNTTTIKSRHGDQKAKLKVKKNKGAKLVAKNRNAEVKVIVSNTANVTAGALRVASAFVPGLSILSGVANAAALVGTVSNLK